MGKFPNHEYHINIIYFLAPRHANFYPIIVPGIEASLDFFGQICRVIYNPNIHLSTFHIHGHIYTSLSQTHPPIYQLVPIPLYQENTLYNFLDISLSILGNRQSEVSATSLAPLFKANWRKHVLDALLNANQSRLLIRGNLPQRFCNL